MAISPKVRSEINRQQIATLWYNRRYDGRVLKTDLAHLLEMENGRPGHTAGPNYDAKKVRNTKASTSRNIYDSSMDSSATFF